MNICFNRKALNFSEVLMGWSTREGAMHVWLQDFHYCQLCQQCLLKLSIGAVLV